MCGIFGYIGPKDCKDIIQNGLEQLEYRGYDSAGVAFKSNKDTLSVFKTLGSASKSNWTITTEEQFNIGIGHTRWSTHGRPTLANAHPHTSNSGKIAIVMNGIIENYQKLRKELKLLYTFKSNTDTEVLAHLIERENEKLSLCEAVKRACSLTKGNFAVAVIHSELPYIVCYSKGVSLHIAQTNFNEHYISSDINTLLPFTKNIGTLKSNHIAIMSTSKLVVKDLNNKVENNFIQEIKTKSNLSNSRSLNGYETYMLKEINEQSNILKNILSSSLTKFDTKFENVVIIGCGSSYNAGLTAKYLFNRLNIPVEVYYASEYKYYSPPIRKNSLFIFLTQSGETADTIGCAKLIRSKELSDIKMLAITNGINSSIARLVDKVEYLNAGAEISIAATKSFTSMLCVLYKIAFSLSNNKDLEKELNQMPDWYSHFIQYNFIKSLVKSLMTENDIEHFIFLGKGYNYPVALEGALKLKEISYIPACGYPSGEMKHGPIALLDKSVAVVVLNNSGRFQSKTISSLKEAETRDAHIINISDTFTDANYNITIPTFSEELTPFINTLVLQLFSYYVAKEKGENIDKPRNLAKSVTVE